MARKKTAENGTGKTNKMEAVRQILAEHPDAKSSEISALLLSQFGIVMDSKMAATYRYNIRLKQRSRQRKAGKAIRAAAPASDHSGYDDMLQAGRKLGWKRVREFVELVMAAKN